MADAADETEAKQRANDIADRVAMLLSFNSPNQGYCSPPLVWNPVTKVCE